MQIRKQNTDVCTELVKASEYFIHIDVLQISWDYLLASPSLRICELYRHITVARDFFVSGVYHQDGTIPEDLVSKVVPVHGVKVYRGSGGVAPLINPTLDGDKRSTSPRGQFTPGQSTPVRTEQEVRWVPEPVWTFWRREKSHVSTGIRTADHQTRNLVCISITLGGRGNLWDGKGATFRLLELDLIFEKYAYTYISSIYCKGITWRQCECLNFRYQGDNE